MSESRTTIDAVNRDSNTLLLSDVNEVLKEK